MGLMRKVEVVEYDPRWPAAFVAEARLVQNALGPMVVALHHIGSTSVPGLAAKPVIDMLLVVADHATLDAANADMAALGYEPRGEFGIPGRRYFSKGGDLRRTHHVHAYEPSHHEVERHLAFRDYLRAHPEEAARYGNLKAELALSCKDDIEAYMDGKAPLIAELLARAQAWRPPKAGRQG
jgi:GrpB-like predicted nucleotidyltransferase (UPF0157 family)